MKQSTCDDDSKLNVLRSFFTVWNDRSGSWFLAERNRTHLFSPSLWRRTSLDTWRSFFGGSRRFWQCHRPEAGARRWPCPSDQYLDNKAAAPSINTQLSENSRILNGRRFGSPPAVKSLPAPETTTTLHSGSAARSLKQSTISLPEKRTTNTRRMRSAVRRKSASWFNTAAHRIIQYH